MTLIVYDLQKNINYNQTNSFELTQKKNQNTFCLKQSAPIWVISYRIISVLSYAVTFDTSRGLLMLQSNKRLRSLYSYSQAHSHNMRAWSQLISTSYTSCVVFLSKTSKSLISSICGLDIRRKNEILWYFLSPGNSICHFQAISLFTTNVSRT